MTRKPFPAGPLTTLGDVSEVPASLSLFVPGLFLLELAQLLLQTQALVKSEVAASPCNPCWGLSPILARLPQAHMGTQLLTKALWKSHGKALQWVGIPPAVNTPPQRPPTAPFFGGSAKGALDSLQICENTCVC